MWRNAIIGTVAALAAATSQAAGTTSAIVVQDQTSLRAAPRGSAQPQAVLWQGDLLEVRGERLDYLQVYDHRRERAGFVHASLVRRTTLSPEEAPELMALVRFLRDRPGSESLGIALAAAWIKAAPAELLRADAGIEAFDALGVFADRLARRASNGSAQGRSAEAALAAHLEAAASYGVRFSSFEREGRMQVCYEGEAFRRVLAMASNPVQRARAALGLTRPECVDPDLRPRERRQLDEWRAEVLDRVEVSALPGYLRNRVLMRAAGVGASLAYQRARAGEAAEPLAQQAIAALAGVAKGELTDDDLRVYDDAAMRTGASRWAAVASPAGAPARGLVVRTEPGQPGETCVVLTDARREAAGTLARRCTYGLVWTASASANKEGTALALAVQPTDAWRELWIFRRTAEGWETAVLPPAPASPDVGYAELAGWVPGGTQFLAAREARSEGKYRRSFELVRIDTLTTERQSGEPGALGAFQRWQDPAWVRATLSVRYRRAARRDCPDRLRYL